MHPRVIAERKAGAQLRIELALKDLAQRLALGSLPPAGLEKSARDPEQRDLLRLESFANLLELLAAAAHKETRAAAKRSG